MLVLPLLVFYWLAAYDFLSGQSITVGLVSTAEVSGLAVLDIKGWEAVLSLCAFLNIEWLATVAQDSRLA